MVFLQQSNYANQNYAYDEASAEEKYASDQSHIDRHRKTTANNPIMYAHLALLLRLFSSFESMVSAKAVPFC